MSANGLHLCKWTVTLIQVILSHLNKCFNELTARSNIFGTNLRIRKATKFAKFLIFGNDTYKSAMERHSAKWSPTLLFLTMVRLIWMPDDLNVWVLLDWNHNLFIIHCFKLNHTVMITCYKWEYITFSWESASARTKLSCMQPTNQVIILKVLCKGAGTHVWPQPSSYVSSIWGSLHTVFFFLFCFFFDLRKWFKTLDPDGPIWSHFHWFWKVKKG